MADPMEQTDILGMTTDIVSAYVTKNRLPAEDLPGLISSIHTALSGAAAPAPAEAESLIEQPTAAAIRKSVTPDYLVSFEDGKRYKSMKRSLNLKGLTPAAYRAKWGLPNDYPMVAPAYAAARSEMAKAMGLGGGRKRANSASPTAKSSKAKA